MTIPELDQHFAEIGRVAGRWVIATVDWLYAAHLATHPPAGLRFVRCGVWDKPNGAPQYTGDRPAQGWEAIAILHTTGTGRMRWNGGGHRAVYRHNVARMPRNPTQKPAALWRQLIALFSDPGDLLLDPFCGAGTTGAAAWQLGSRAMLTDRSLGELISTIKYVEATRAEGFTVDPRWARFGMDTAPPLGSRLWDKLKRHGSEV